MKKYTLLLSAVSFLSAGVPALAQGGPPPVLQIFREEVKPGKAAAHTRVEAGWPRAFARAKWPQHYLAIVSRTGPSEAWFLTGYDSMAAWEKDTNSADQNAALTAELDQLSAQDGELVSSTRSIVATYREDLSYRANINLSEMRYFSITTVRIRPGHESAFVEARKMVNSAHEKANMDEHWAIFQVTSGMPSGTYLIFLPMKSLQQVDAAAQMHGSAYQAALGEEGRAKLREMAASGTIVSETNLFALSPRMSYPSPEIVAGDPDFWAPKPAPRTTPKPAPKPAGSQ